MADIDDDVVAWLDEAHLTEQVLAAVRSSRPGDSAAFSELATTSHVVRPRVLRFGASEVGGTPPNADVIMLGLVATPECCVSGRPWRVARPRTQK